MPKVGLFFLVKDDQLLMESVNLEYAMPYGDFRILDVSHFDVWADRYERLYRKPYDYFPRGRVVYNTTTHTFVQYADPCIDQSGLARIREAFGITGEVVTVDQTDLHYTCNKCNSWYCDI